MRPHRPEEAAAVIEVVASWQASFLELLGRRLVYAADEYYLLAGREFPPADIYDGFPMHEDGIGMARNFELEFAGVGQDELTPQAGFFASVDGAPAEGYRAPRVAEWSPAGSGAGPAVASGQPVVLRPGRRPNPGAPVGIVTSGYGAQVLGPIIETYSGSAEVRLVVVDNRFFGGNIAVTGLLVGEDIARVLADEPAGHRYLLPDVCLSGGVFLDGSRPEDLPRPVEIVTTSGTALRAALDGRAVASMAGVGR